MWSQQPTPQWSQKKDEVREAGEWLSENPHLHQGIIS